MNRIKKFFALMLSTIFMFAALPMNVKAITNSSGDELADGTYKGEAPGFKDKPITAEIHVQGGKVDKFDLDGSTQTTNFWNSTEGLRKDIGESLVNNNSFTTDFDAVSGATYSSRGIINAVDNALKNGAIDESSTTNGSDDVEKPEDKPNADGEESSDNQDDSSESDKDDKDKKDDDKDNDTDIEDDDNDKEEIELAGDGTKENPFIIENEKQLRGFALSFSDENDYNGQYIKLVNDIDLTEGDWLAIGEGEYPFNGDFNGDGHYISGLKVGSSDAPYLDNGTVYYGLFGVLEKNGYIHDVKVDLDIYVESNSSELIGGICAYNQGGAIDNCTVKGNIWGRSGLKNLASNHLSGGIVGMMSRGSITNCINYADIFAQSTGGVAEAGGMVGLNNRGLVANCIGNGNISGSSDRKSEGMTSFGSIAGVHAGTMTSCIGNSNITSNYSMYIGELAGWATGIGYLYNNFYNDNAIVQIDGKNVSKIESVGWLVGPGVSDENEPYAGGINYMPTAITANEINTENLSEKLNSTFNSYPVEVKSFSPNAKLRKWMVSADTILPIGDEQEYVYKEVVIEQEEMPEKEIEGAFYGRSKDKSVVVSAAKDDNGQLKITVESGDSAEGLEAYDEAVESAKNKIDLDDHTSYGLVDPSIFESGDGTVNNPFVIATEAQLREFNKSINTDESYEGKYIVLDNDINLTNEWILTGGSNPYPFRGNFDGKGHTISNIVIGSIEAPSNYRYAGLFPYLEGAVVKNLNIDNVSICTKTNDDRRFYAGALASAADSTGREGCIDSVNITNANIKIETYSGAAYGGGLVGSNQFDVIANCKVDANVETVSKAAWNYTGILTGITARSAIINNRVSGKLSVSGNLNKAAAGGIGGFVCSLTYNNAGNVDITSERYTNDLGQVAGRNTGIAYNVRDYFDTDSSIICAGEKIDSRAIGTIVSGTSEGKGRVGEMVGLTRDRFISSELLQLLNAAVDAPEYQEVINFLDENWGIKFEALAAIKPWSVNTEQVTIVDTTNESTELNTQGSNNNPNPVIDSLGYGSVAVNNPNPNTDNLGAGSVVANNPNSNNVGETYVADNIIAENNIVLEGDLDQSTNNRNSNSSNLQQESNSNSNNGNGHSSVDLTVGDEATNLDEDESTIADEISDEENTEIEKDKSSEDKGEKVEADSGNNSFKVVGVIILAAVAGAGVFAVLRYRRKL